MTPECGKCLQWFHPTCLGIEETDDTKLNQMDVMCTNCLDLDDDQEEDEEAFLGKRTSRQDSADFDPEESLHLDKLSADPARPEADEEDASEKLQPSEQVGQDSKENELADAAPAQRAAPLKERNKNQEQPLADSDASRDGKPPSQSATQQPAAKSSLLHQL